MTLVLTVTARGEMFLDGPLCGHGPTAHYLGWFLPILDSVTVPKRIIARQAPQASDLDEPDTPRQGMLLGSWMISST
jgi:hypothetical protein